MIPSEVKWHPVLVRAVIGILKNIFIDGYYADKVIERAFKQNKKWGGRDRRFVAETVYDMVRWWGYLSALLDEPTNFDDGQICARWILYEFKFHGRDATKFANEYFAGDSLFTISNVNQRVTKAALTPWDQVSFPQWLYEKIRDENQEKAGAIFNALNETAPVFLRANTLKTTRDELIRTLTSEIKSEGFDVSACPDATDAIVLSERRNVFVTQAFKQGLFEVQDLSSQKVVPLLEPKPGERIADVCAGAGGKTLHLAAMMKNKGTLVASDILPRKLDELRVRARRAGVSNLRIVDLNDSKQIKRQSAQFDGVLIDAPCSGTGVIRRNGDTKWKLKPENLAALLKTQSEILDRYSKLVKPGGRLLYVTCSILKEENERRVESFVGRHPEFSVVGAPFFITPSTGGGDGFFAQKMMCLSR